MRVFPPKELSVALRVLVVALVVLAGVAALVAAAEAQQRGGRGNLTPEERAVRQAAADEALREELAAPTPISALDSVWIEELTWMEVRDALAAGKTTAIISTGGIEPNGPWVATGKHNYVLQAACEGIARELGNALCAPIVKLVPEGNIEEPSGHMRYPGTISVKEETFRAILDDVASSLHAHGFEHIVFIGDSGGNQRGQAAVAELLNERWGEPIAHHVGEFYNYADVEAYMENDLGVDQPVDDGLHDNFYITSIMMTVDPTVVRYEQRVAAGEATINGVSIAPAEEAIAVGEKLLRYRVETTVAAINAAIAAAR